MGLKLSTVHLAIYKKIDEILYYDWNPIGNDELPRDEYENYTPQIFSLKIRGASVDEIARRLYEIESKTIGMPSTIENCTGIARMIYEL